MLWDKVSLKTPKCYEHYISYINQLLDNNCDKTFSIISLGIIRNIDPVNKLFYILTPVPRDKLERVNLLQKGSLEIPTCLLLQVSDGVKRVVEKRKINCAKNPSNFTFRKRKKSIRLEWKELIFILQCTITNIKESVLLRMVTPIIK